ncbi:MAG: VOC family protein, partial [Chloroflexota bacterium]
MRERDGFPAGVPAWIDTNQPDAEAPRIFYGGLFDWRFENRMPAESSTYLVATLDGKDVAAVGTPLPGGPATPAWNTYVAVDDADDSVAKVREAGGTVIVDALDVGDLGRLAVCADPSGAEFRLWQPGTIKGAQAVNMPGTWNFSELNARDIDGAKRFYGAVFGWEADEVDMGAMAGTMLRLPGYADFLEQFDPELRKRHAEFGAPPGFSECIGWILPLKADEAPHWSVTFTVADTDAVVATARKL